MNSDPHSHIFSSIEALSNQLSRKPKGNLNSEIYSAKVPEIQVFERIYMFRKTDFQYTWSLMILLVNIYNFFSAGYFFGTLSYPTGTWLGLELLCEGALLVDFFIRYSFRKSQNPNKLWFLQENLKKHSWVFLSLSSFPYSTISVLLSNTSHNFLIVVRFMKLLRLFQLRNFWKKQGLIFTSPFIYTIQALLIILGTTHYCAMFWLFVCEYKSLECFSYTNQAELYISAFFKASETLTGLVQISTESHTDDQKVLSLFIMSIGVILYGSIFVKVSIKMLAMNQKRIERANRKEILSCWCREREIDKNMQQRINSYALLEEENFFERIKLDLPSELPISLRSEIALFTYKSLISKSKIFELGEPSFMLSMVRSFDSQIYLPGDFIIRHGDSSDSMYFICSGLVEVLATDGSSRIALLDDGNYFGEIGILMSCCRTVSIKSVQPSILACIPKTKLMKILSNFPEHYEFLHDVAIQRMKTCTKEDIDIDYDLVEDDFSSSDSDNSGELETPQYYAPVEHEHKNFLLKMITVPHSKSQKGTYHLDPLSPFFYFWTLLLFIAYTTCVFLVPYCIVYDQSYYFLMIDLACYIVFVLDIYVNYNSAIITKFHSYIHEKEEIKLKYLDRFFLLDLLAIIPSDWVYCSIECNSPGIYYLKLLRLLKGFRLIQLFSLIKNYSNVSVHLLRPMSFVYIFFMFSHICACLIKFLPTTAISDKYIDNLHWSYSIFSQTSYADIGPTSSLGMALSVVLMLVSKVFVVILYSDSSSLIAEYSKPYTDFVGKTRLTVEWMNHCKIPIELRNGVINYLQLQWDKLLGVTDEEILSYLPESLTTDLRLKLFSGIIESGLFPLEQKGAILGIIRQCKLSLINKNTEIITQGEIGLEMFFILDGLVEVILPNTSITRELGEGCIFGELAIIDDMPGIRNATIIAKTDITLASLSLEDFKYVSSLYPGFEEKVKELAMIKTDSIDRAVSLISEANQKNDEFLSEDFIKRFDISQFDDSVLGRDKHDDVIDKAVISSLLDTTAFESKRKRVVFKPWVIRLYNNSMKMHVYFVVWAWNVLFIPYQVAFDAKFTSAPMFFEVVTILFYLSAGVYFIIIYLTSKSHHIKTFGSRKVLLALSLHHFLLAVPLSLIFSFSSQSRILAAVLSYIRITNMHFVKSYFSWLKKKKIFWYILIHCIEILINFIAISHLVACLFIFIGRNENKSWISILDSQSNYEVYVNALYWAVGSLLHTTVGDVISLTGKEKTFNCIVQLCSFFIYGLLFGSITSIISTFNSNLVTWMYNDYAYAMKYIVKKGIGRKFSMQIDEYFNFLWDKNKGIMEAKALENLPQALKTDIFMHLHRETLQKSEMFLQDLEVNQALVKSIYRLMSMQYYLIGDVILRIDDSSYDMYYIISGEVTIISIKGNSIINTLKNGDYFGEANILFGTSIRTATVVATKISQIGTINKQSLEILLAAYPDWKEKLLRTSKDRLMQNFQISETDNVNKICEELSEKITQSPEVYNIYSKKTDILIAHKVAEILYIDPLNKQLTLNILHLILIFYSCFAIPLEITYMSSIKNWMIVFEIICIGESIIYLAILLTNAIKHKNKEVLNYYIKRSFLLDLAAVSPFNLILPLASVYEPRMLVMALRLIRLFSVFRIHSILSNLLTHFKILFSWLYISESLLYLVIFIHWVTSILNFNNSCPSQDTYLDSLYFTMNLVTSTGHTDSHPCEDMTKIQFCIISFISTAAIAGIYGLLAYIYSTSMNFLNNNSSQKPTSSEIVTFYNKTLEKFEVLNYEDMTENIKTRIESFCKFSAALEYFYGETVNKEIYAHLPSSIVDNLVYEKYRKMLKKLPFLKNNDSEVLIKKLALSLQAEVYLPNDFLIYKDDIGDEMYFISIGAVNIIAPDNSKVIKTLQQGDFFGEMALINNSRRMCSVIAQTLCLVFALKRKDLNDILRSFPDVLKQMRQQSDIRSRETTSVIKNSINLVNEDEEQNKLFNHLNMYSMLSSSFATVVEDKHKLSLLSGMKNMRVDMSFETFAKDKSQLRIFKRRPVAGGINERRKSQEALGKKMVIKRFTNLKNRWSNKL